MKKVVAILMVSLLGFLGCSDSDDGTTPPGQSVLVAPFGIIETPSPTYEWTPVPWATKYRLLVEDTSETAVIEEWYTAEESGCASEDGLCMVTPDIEVFEENTWKVQACVNEGCGLWSGPMNFDFTANNAPRFTDHGDGTVTDNNTKLMWSKHANLCGKQDWYDAMNYCEGVAPPVYSDWRLPSISELKSLIDRNQLDPALPPGYPFTNVRSYFYWSSSTNATDIPDVAWAVDFNDGYVSYIREYQGLYMWCVRGGH